MRAYCYCCAASKTAQIPQPNSNLKRMENAMTLANLKLTTAKKATQLSAVVQRRTKLVKRLAEQIELAKAAQNGSTYAPTKLRSITDA